MKKILIYTFTLFMGAFFGTNEINAQDTNYPSMSINGRIHYDLNFINYGEEAFGGQEFRRMMFTAKGKVAERVAYSAQFEFAGGKLGFRDVYVKLGTLPYVGGYLKIGNFAEPTGLTMLTSSKYIPFIERAMLTSTQTFRWNSGFMYENHNLLNSKLGMQLAYTFNGDKNAAFLDNQLLDGGNFIGRLYGVAYKNTEKNHALHLGVNYERRDNPSGSFKLSFRPETHMYNKITYSHDVDLQNDLGFELATTFGPLSLQGEYEMSRQDVGGETYSVNGYYALASFFITGEGRNYKKGSFGRVKPKNDFCALDNKWGAVELLARYSVMDFTDAMGVASFNGTDVEAVKNITIGLNWYLNKHTKLMYNFIYGDLGHDDNYLSNLVRVQVDF